jgi:excinuclease UvrABC ATPase subunit
MAQVSDLEPVRIRGGADLLGQLKAKLGFLLRVGLGYLTLGRQTKRCRAGKHSACPWPISWALDWLAPCMC